MPAHKIIYKPEHAKTARKVCALFGADNNQLAEVLGVSPRTLVRWRQDYPDLQAAVLAGKDEFDSGHVEDTLLRKAMGCQCERCRDNTQRPPANHVRPDTIACIFWLKNRQPDRWKDRTEHAFEGGLTLNLSLQKTYEPNGTKAE